MERGEACFDFEPEIYLIGKVNSVLAVAPAEYSIWLGVVCWKPQFIVQADFQFSKLDRHHIVKQWNIVNLSIIFPLFFFH